jgi:hypothetical protein
MKINNIIAEELSKETQNKFRDLIKKLHPDKGGSTKEAQELIRAKEKEDEGYILSLHKKLFDTKKDNKINLATYQKWAQRFASVKNLISIVKKINNEITVEYIKRTSANKYPERATLFNAEKFKTENEFIRASMNVIRKLRN